MEDPAAILVLRHERVPLHLHHLPPLPTSTFLPQQKKKGMLGRVYVVYIA